MHSIEQQSFAVLIYALSAMSLISSIGTVALIRDMNRWTAYVYIIQSLAIAEIVYCLTFFFVTCDTETCNRISLFTATVGGIATSLWTNVMSVTVTSIVINLRSCNLMKYYPIYFGIILTTSTLLMMANELTLQTNYFTLVTYVYYSFRVVSIAFNLVTYAICSVTLYRRGYEGICSKQDDPVRMLVQRVKYYPLWQTMTWFELSWVANDSFPTNPWVLAVVFIFAICSSAAGVGYFLIFLTMQPSASAHLVSRLCPVSVLSRASSLMSRITDRGAGVNSVMESASGLGPGSGSQDSDTGNISMSSANTPHMPPPGASITSMDVDKDHDLGSLNGHMSLSSNNQQKLITAASGHHHQNYFARDRDRDRTASVEHTHQRMMSADMTELDEDGLSRQIDLLYSEHTKLLRKT